MARNFPLKNGHYCKTFNHWMSYMYVEDTKATAFDSSGASIEMRLTFGDFGEADPEIVEKTGKKIYNFQFSYTFGQEFKELGVVSEDGLKITTKGLMGVAEMEWKTDEEMEAIKNSGDPAEAPPGPYKLCPEQLGKFLWITGPPGLGKSTSAQLLGRHHGFAYYEADCFSSCRNPYIPLDSPDPSVAQVNQRPLVGDKIKERKKLVEETKEIFEAMFSGKEFDMEKLKVIHNVLLSNVQWLSHLLI